MKKSYSLTLLIVFCSIAINAQDKENCKNDSSNVTLLCKRSLIKNSGIPIFNSDEFEYTYKLSGDTIHIVLSPNIDTIEIKEGSLKSFEYIRTKKKCSQTINIPKRYYIKPNYLIIEFKHINSYMFTRKRNKCNIFHLKYILE